MNENILRLLMCKSRLAIVHVELACFARPCIGFSRFSRLHSSALFALICIGVTAILCDFFAEMC